MRQLLHHAVGIFFWLLMAVLWVLLVMRGKVGVASLGYSAAYVGAVGSAVLAVTTWWIRHNTAIYRRKGPRQGRPSALPDTTEDRLGRPVRWQLPGGPDAALLAGHLVVELDGEAKVYRAAAG
jgi:hypothetical protein